MDHSRDWGFSRRDLMRTMSAAGAAALITGSATAQDKIDKVVVGVVNNPLRKDKTLFTAEERKTFIEEATGSLANVEVQVFSTLLVEFARENGAHAIVKGMRAISDFEYEFEMAQLNRKLDPGIESIYVIASPHYSFLSSTGVKEMATFGGDVSDLVPPAVATALAERLGNR